MGKINRVVVSPDGSKTIVIEGRPTGSKCTVSNLISVKKVSIGGCEAGSTVTITGTLEDGEGTEDYGEFEFNPKTINCKTGSSPAAAAPTDACTGIACTGLASSQHAQKSWCNGDNDASDNQKIRGCTGMINSGKE